MAEVGRRRLCTAATAGDDIAPGPNRRADDYDVEAALVDEVREATCAAEPHRLAPPGLRANAAKAPLRLPTACTFAPLFVHVTEPPGDTRAT
jgi:hypothetical protein